MNDKNNDIFLLNNNPNSLILKYMPVIKSLVVKKLIKTGYFLFQDMDDKVQGVVEGLLKDIKKIRKSYNGYSRFKPFFIQIIKNRCNELRRKEYRQETREIVNNNPDNPGFDKKVVFTKRNSFTQITNDNISGNSNETDKNIIIESELDYLDVVFRMYALQKTKLLICMKILAGFTVTDEELKFYNNTCKQNIYDTVINFTGKKESNTNEAGYQILTDFFNCCNKTNKKKDAIRKWINKMLAEIIVQMNRDMTSPVYNKENIRGLIELYFEWKRKNNS